MFLYSIVLYGIRYSNVKFKRSLSYFASILEYTLSCGGYFFWTFHFILFLFFFKLGLEKLQMIH